MSTTPPAPIYIGRNGKPLAPQKEGYCHYFMKDKAIFCRQQTTKTETLCAKHRREVNAESDPSSSARCPLGCSALLRPGQIPYHVSVKCPFALNKKRAQTHAAFLAGLNVGPADGAEGRHSDLSLAPETIAAVTTDAERALFDADTPPPPAKQRAVYARALGAAAFESLVDRLVCAHGRLLEEEGMRAEGDIPSVPSPFPRETDYADPDLWQIWETGHALADKNKRPLSRKHFEQQAAIIAAMRRHALLPTPPIEEPLKPLVPAPSLHDNGSMDLLSPYRPSLPVPGLVEYGAGKGYLALLLCETHTVGYALLEDNRVFKTKADRRLRFQPFERITIDMADFNPYAVEKLVEQKSFIACGKHLCGAATDLTLRSADLGGPSSPPKSLQCAGLAIATCCHHVCVWRHYVGKQKFLAWGLSPEDFEIASYMSSWALCGHGGGAGEDDDGEGEGEGEDTMQPAAEDEKEQDAAHYAFFDPVRALDRSRKQQIGRMCKDLIDGGRLAYLRDRWARVGDGGGDREEHWQKKARTAEGPAGGSAQLTRASPNVRAIRYALPSVTGECTLLLAKRPSDSVLA